MTLRPACVSICGTWRAAIRAWGGARPMSWRTARAWWPTPSAHGASGATSACNARRSDGPSAAGSQTAPPRGCAPNAPTTCGPGLPVRRDRRPAPHQASQHRRRVHPRGAGRRAPRRPARRPRPPQDGQRPRAHLRATLRDWCRIWGTHTAHIEPGSPWENSYIESFNGRLRDECLNTEDFANLLEAQVVLEDWRTEYNNYRPHQSLAGLTPAAYADHWTHHHSHKPSPMNGGKLFSAIKGPACSQSRPDLPESSEQSAAEPDVPLNSPKKSVLAERGLLLGSELRPCLKVPNGRLAG